MNKILLFTGDSITDAGHLWQITPNFWGNGYVALVGQKMSKDKVVNCGHDGATSDRMRRWWRADCISKSPDVVTILAGINDLSEEFISWKKMDGAERYGENLEWMINETREKTGAELILMEPFIFPRPAEYMNWIKPLERYRKKVRGLADRYKTGFVPLWDVFEEAQRKYSVDELTVDGIHLTGLGHEILAESWLAVYEKMENFVS